MLAQHTLSWGSAGVNTNSARMYLDDWIVE